MAEGRQGSADQVKQDEFEFSQHVLDIIPENPHIQHVASEMPQAGVQKHGRINGGIGGYRKTDQLAGDQSILVVKVREFHRHSQAVNENENIRPDQCNS